MRSMCASFPKGMLPYYAFPPKASIALSNVPTPAMTPPQTWSTSKSGVPFKTAMTAVSVMIQNRTDPRIGFNFCHIFLCVSF